MQRRHFRLEADVAIAADAAIAMANAATTNAAAAACVANKLTVCGDEQTKRARPKTNDPLPGPVHRPWPLNKQDRVGANGCARVFGMRAMGAASRGQLAHWRGSTLISHSLADEELIDVWLLSFVECGWLAEVCSRPFSIKVVSFRNN